MLHVRVVDEFYVSDGVTGKAPSPTIVDFPRSMEILPLPLFCSKRLRSKGSLFLCVSAAQYWEMVHRGTSHY